MEKFLKRLAFFVGGTLLAAGVYIGELQVTDNFHEVLPGQLYRSAQPSPGELENYIRRYGIKTVINLRGESRQDWYRQEVATTEEMSAEHIDFKMSAGHQLTAEQSRELLAILRDAPKPVLIHCFAGSDRTGLASLIYLRQVANVKDGTAEWQLSPLYGHLNLPFLKAYAMDRTWSRIERHSKVTES